VSIILERYAKYYFKKNALTEPQGTHSNHIFFSTHVIMWHTVEEAMVFHEEVEDERTNKDDEDVEPSSKHR